MKNLPAEIMWLESAKKQVEIAKDAYKEAKIHLLNSLKDSDTVITVNDYWYVAVKEEVDRVDDTIKLCSGFNHERCKEFDIDKIDIYPIADEDGNITIKIMKI